jgi:hypothetical protein
MDTSETTKWYEDPVYHKMCEKAEEIQNLRTYKFLQGDYVDIKDVPPTIIIAGDDEIRDSISIWLPRQDQLQEMVNPYDKERNIEWHSDNKAYDLLRAFFEFCGGYEYEISYPTPYAEGLRSMEQLWLGFVIKERWNKVWDGQNWVMEKVVAK